MELQEYISSITETSRSPSGTTLTYLTGVVNKLNTLSDEVWNNLPTNVKIYSNNLICNYKRVK
jgi:hypothetical protein